MAGTGENHWESETDRAPAMATACNAADRYPAWRREIQPEMDGQAWITAGHRTGGPVACRIPSYLSLAFIVNTFTTKNGQELAPASPVYRRADRLLWRRRAFPSATLDKMRAEL